MVKWNNQTTKLTPQERLHMLYKYCKVGQIELVREMATAKDLKALKKYYGIELEGKDD